MAHYAELNQDNEVICVVYMDNEIIVDDFGNEVDQLGVDHLHLHHGEDRRWLRTSYRANFRGKYAGIGDTYREDLDMFIPKQPYPSWTLNMSEFCWEPPVPVPTLTQEHEDNNQYYLWSEEEYLASNNGWILTTYETPVI